MCAQHNVIHTQTHTYIHTYIHPYIYIYMYFHIFPYISICVCVYIYIFSGEHRYISFHPWKQDGLPEKRWFLRPFRVYFFSEVVGNLMTIWHNGHMLGHHEDAIVITSHWPPWYWWTHWGFSWDVKTHVVTKNRLLYTYDISVSENIQIHKYPLVN